MPEPQQSAQEVEMESLRAENAILRTYLNEDLLLRLAVEHGWEHEPNNPQGKWCCDEHRQSFYDGTLYGSE